MLTLHFFRHGQTNFNAEKRVQGQFDSVLTELGIEQAIDSRSLVEQLSLSAVYTSTNVRAMHTAQILTENLTLDIGLRDGLREIMMGPWQERLYAEVAKSDPDDMENFIKAPDKFVMKGAETFAQVQSRGVKTLEAIIASEKQGHVLIVSHGVMIKTILCRYAKLGLRHVWDNPHLGNCSHSIVEVRGHEDYKVTKVGDKRPQGTIWAA